MHYVYNWFIFHYCLELLCLGWAFCSYHHCQVNTVLFSVVKFQKKWLFKCIHLLPISELLTASVTSTADNSGWGKSWFASCKTWLDYVLGHPTWFCRYSNCRRLICECCSACICSLNMFQKTHLTCFHVSLKCFLFETWWGNAWMTKMPISVTLCLQHNHHLLQHFYSSVTRCQLPPLPVMLPRWWCPLLWQVLKHATFIIHTVED